MSRFFSISVFVFPSSNRSLSNTPVLYSFVLAVVDVGTSLRLKLWTVASLVEEESVPLHPFNILSLMYLQGFVPSVAKLTIPVYLFLTISDVGFWVNVYVQAWFYLDVLSASYLSNPI